MGNEILELPAACLHPAIVNAVLVPDLDHDLYWSRDWSPDYYIAQARSGCIATACVHQGQDLLLPELQTAYAVLDWPALRLDPPVRKLIASRYLAEEDFHLEIAADPAAVAATVAAIQTCHAPQCWLSPAYADLLQACVRRQDHGFRLLSVTLRHGDGSALAGEIGYLVGGVYTSLSGYLQRSDPRHRNMGKVQLVWLARVLQQAGCAFWNLGHPWMDYKKALGAVVLDRSPFIQRWQAAIALPAPELEAVLHGHATLLR